MPPECERCGQAPHPDCRNGSIVTDDSGKFLQAVECPYLKMRRVVDAFHRRVPPAFVKVQMAKHTPLYVPRSATKEGKDLTDRNLFITGVPWNPVFISHLKKVLFCKPNMTYQIVTDARIKDVYLGAEAFKGLPEPKRKDAHNTLEDLVSESYDLVVIHLGQMLHKNSSAAHVLRQALVYRHNYQKPTWLFQSSDPGLSWDLSRDPDVEEFVRTNFEALELEGESVKQVFLRSSEAEEPTGIVVDEEPVRQLPARKEPPALPAPRVEQPPADLESMVGDMYNDKPKWKKRRGR